MGTTVETAAEIRPFHVEIPDEALDDLRQRIAATNWPEKETVADESQGVKLEMTQEPAHYWATDYDWRKVEARAQRPAAVHHRDRRSGHPLHSRQPDYEDALPLIINHGWPGSIIEQLKIIEPLTDPTARRRERSRRL